MDEHAIIGIDFGDLFVDVALVLVLALAVDGDGDGNVTGLGEEDGVDEDANEKAVVTIGRRKQLIKVNMMILAWLEKSNFFMVRTFILSVIHV